MKCANRRAVKVIRRRTHERTIEKFIHTYIHTYIHINIYTADFHSTQLMIARSLTNSAKDKLSISNCGSVARSELISVYTITITWPFLHVVLHRLTVSLLIICCFSKVHAKGPSVTCNFWWVCLSRCGSVSGIQIGGREFADKEKLKFRYFYESGMILLGRGWFATKFHKAHNSARDFVDGYIIYITVLNWSRPLVEFTKSRKKELHSCIPSVTPQAQDIKLMREGGKKAEYMTIQSQKGRQHVKHIIIIWSPNIVTL